MSKPNIRGGEIVHSLYPRLKVLKGETIAVIGIIVSMALILGLGGCTGVSRMVEISSSTPVAHKLTPELYALESAKDAESLAQTLNPQSQYLSSWKALEPALQASLKYTETKEPGQVAVAHGDIAVTWGEIARTLKKLQELLPRLDKEPELLASRFRWVRLTEGAAFSGYYEPVFKASPTQKAGYTYPLYKLPPDLKQIDLGLFKDAFIGQNLAYRLERGIPVPYYTRAEIDGTGNKPGVLRGKGLELAWLKDPLDAYFLHVQGSGRLQYEDGSEQSILYAGVNGREYLSIGRYLSDLGLIAPGEISMQSIRRWLQEHPEQRESVLHHNQRYVFFRLEPKGKKNSNPIGTMGAPVTPWVSLAVDRETFPLGAALAFDVNVPTLESSGSPTSIRGIGFAQDTGEAITERRVDLFCGRGERAAFTAGHLNDRGQVWMLLAI